MVQNYQNNFWFFFYSWNKEREESFGIGCQAYLLNEMSFHLQFNIEGTI